MQKSHEQKYENKEFSAQEGLSINFTRFYSKFLRVIQEDPIPYNPLISLLKHYSDYLKTIDEIPNNKNILGERIDINILNQTLYPDLAFNNKDLEYRAKNISEIIYYFGQLSKHGCLGLFFLEDEDKGMGILSDFLRRFFSVKDGVGCFSTVITFSKQNLVILLLGLQTLCFSKCIKGCFSVDITEKIFENLDYFFKQGDLNDEEIIKVLNSITRLCEYDNLNLKPKHFETIRPWFSKILAQLTILDTTNDIDFIKLCELLQNITFLDYYYNKLTKADSRSLLVEVNAYPFQKVLKNLLNSKLFELALTQTSDYVLSQLKISLYYLSYVFRDNSEIMGVINRHKIKLDSKYYNPDLNTTVGQKSFQTCFSKKTFPNCTVIAEKTTNSGYSLDFEIIFQNKKYAIEIDGNVHFNIQKKLYRKELFRDFILENALDYKKVIHFTEKEINESQNLEALIRNRFKENNIILPFQSTTKTNHTINNTYTKVASKLTTKQSSGNIYEVLALDEKTEEKNNSLSHLNTEEFISLLPSKPKMNNPNLKKRNKTEKNKKDLEESKNPPSDEKKTEKTRACWRHCVLM